MFSGGIFKGSVMVTGAPFVRIGYVNVDRCTEMVASRSVWHELLFADAA